MSKPAQQDSTHETEVMRGVAGRIRQARLNAKLSQNDLADRTGLKRAYVYELERETSNPTLRTLARVAQAFGLAPVDLMPQSEGPRMRRQDVEALLATLEKTATTIKAGHETVVRQSQSAIDEFRTHLERMLPLGEDGAVQDETA